MYSASDTKLLIDILDTDNGRKLLDMLLKRTLMMGNSESDSTTCLKRVGAQDFIVSLIGVIDTNKARLRKSRSETNIKENSKKRG